MSLAFLENFFKFIHFLIQIHIPPFLTPVKSSNYWCRTSGYLFKLIGKKKLENFRERIVGERRKRSSLNTSILIPAVIKFKMVTNWKNPGQNDYYDYEERVKLEKLINKLLFTTKFLPNFVVSMEAKKNPNI